MLQQLSFTSNSELCVQAGQAEGETGWVTPNLTPNTPRPSPVREPGLFQGELLQEGVPVLQELPHVGLHQGDADALLPAPGSPVHALLVVVVHHTCEHRTGHQGHTHGSCWGLVVLSPPVSPVGNAVLASCKSLVSFAQRGLQKGLAFFGNQSGWRAVRLHF